MPSKHKTIAVFSGNRAEYGLLYPILKAIHEHPNLTLHLYAGGDHTRLGTISEIEADGLPIFQTLGYDTPLDGNSPASLMSVATADILPKMQQHFAKKRPDVFFVLGDRYESFGATLAAFYEKIPVAHLGGGDMTEGGCVDDTLRFMISDIAHVHFCISKDSADRLLQRGEESWRIHVTGSPVIDNIANIQLLNKEALCAETGLNPNLPIILFTQHPIPSEGQITVQAFSDSIQALGELGESRQVQVIATHPNQDGFGEQFTTLIEDAKRKYPNISWNASLGRVHYLSWMAVCDAVLGNSSSGLIETPFFKTASVTVGPRQKGRYRAENILACDYGVETVKQAISTALFDESFLKKVKTCSQVFGSEPCTPGICKTLLTLPENDVILQKKLYSKASEPVFSK